MCTLSKNVDSTNKKSVNCYELIKKVISVAIMQQKHPLISNLS